MDPCERNRGQRHDFRLGLCKGRRGGLPRDALRRFLERDPLVETITIENSIPEVDSASIAILPATPTSSDTVTVSFTDSDADNDALTYTLSWYVNGVFVTDSNDLTMDLSSLGVGGGNELFVAIIASDGEDDSAPAISLPLMIDNNTPAASNVDVFATTDDDQDGDTQTARITDTLDCAYDFFDQDGDADQSTVTISTSAQGISEVSVGRYHACAVSWDGALNCWGITDGSGADRGQVSDMPTGTFTSVSVSEWYSCAIDDGGVLQCWGIDDGTFNLDYGQVTAAPTQAGMSQVAAGVFHACALDTSGVATCWGDNAYGVSTPPSTVFSNLISGNGFSWA